MTKALITSICLIAAGYTVTLPAMAQLGPFGLFGKTGDKTAQERTAKMVRANQLEREGKINEAITLTEELLKEAAAESRSFLRPPSLDVVGTLKMRLGRLLSKIGEHDKAISIYEEGMEGDRSSNLINRALATRPEGVLLNASARLGLIDLYIAAKRYEKAEALTQAMRKQFSELQGRHDALAAMDIRLGEIALAQNDNSKAETFFLSAIKESDASVSAVEAAAPNRASFYSAESSLLGSFAAAREALKGLYKNTQVGDGSLQDMLDAAGPGSSAAMKSDDVFAKASSLTSMYGALIGIYLERKDKGALLRLYDTEFKRTRQQAVTSANPTDLNLGGFGSTPVAIEQTEFKFARAFATLGMGREAEAAFRASMEANDDRLRNTFLAMTTDFGDGAFTVRREYANGWISSALSNPGGDINSLFTAIASTKGIGLEYSTALPRVVQSMKDERLKSDFERLLIRKETPLQFQLRANADAENKKAAEFASDTISLENAIRKRLKPQLAQQFVKSGLVQGAITTAAVFDSLKPSSAYIEFIKFSNLNAAGKPTGPARYAAIALDSATKRASLTDLGDASAIDAIITSYGMEIRAPNASSRLPNEIALKRMGRALFEKTIKPALTGMNGKTLLVLSPDSELNLVPFEALVDESGAYLIDKMDIQYVASAREWLRRDLPSSVNRTAVIFANPDFDAATTSKPIRLAPNSTRSLALRSARGTLLRNEKFSALPDTQMEGEAAKLALTQGFGVESSLFVGQAATASELFRLNGPRFLHLATHGFFLETGNVLESKSGESKQFTTFDPGKLSGVVLAGASRLLAEGDDSGLVYSSKLATLNLNGTELAVISACETGVGVVEAGEGVLGIRRSLSLAGAQASITTLWSVASAETTELMSSFYAKLAEKKDRAVALREAKLALKKKSPNPLFWAAFVLSGTPNR